MTRLGVVFSLLTLVFAMSSGAESASGSPWWQNAIRLSGEKEEIKNAALEALRQTPKLEEALRGELSSKQSDRKYLALDVISALKLKGMFDDLLRFSESDETGFYSTALSSLIDESNLERARKTFHERALSSSVAPASRVVLIDTLARMGAELTRAEVETLLRDRSFEVRQSALGYLRQRLVGYGETEVLDWLKPVLDSQPWQLRLEAFYLVSEASPRARRSWESVFSRCTRDSNSEVATFCQKISQKGSWSAK